MAKRRGHGEGSITERADGRWQARISLGGYGKSRRVKYLYGSTHEVVMKKLRAELVDRDKGKTLSTGEAPLLKTFAAGWLEGVKPTLKDSSWEFYDDNLRLYIPPAIGGLNVNAVRRKVVLKLIRDLRKKGLATTTVRGIIRTLSACLSGVVDDEHLDANPAQSLRKHLRKREDEVHEPDPLTPEELEQLLETARVKSPRWQPFILCAARTGLRLGELIGLDWTDLDEKAATLTIERAFVRGALTTPKNHQQRKVDISPQLLKGLLALRASQGAFSLKKGRPAPTILFPAVGGVERLDESNVRKVLKRICTAAKVRPRSPHALRDTFASQLLSKNAPLLYVSRQLGHSSAAVTLNHYAKWLPNPTERFVNVLDGGSAAMCGSNCGSDEAATVGEIAKTA
jgi:integrase